MYKSLKNIFISLLTTAVLVIGLAVALSYLFKIELQTSSLALFLGIIGTIVAFLGNNLIGETIGKYGSRDMPQWKWGNRIQVLGFALTIVALIIK